MADVTYIPEGNNQGNSVLPWMLASNGGFGGMNSAWPLLFAMNGGGFGGFGGWGGMRTRMRSLQGLTQQPLEFPVHLHLVLVCHRDG